MNYPSQSSVEGRHATKDTRHRVPRDQNAYNSASEALDAYIAAFEKRTNLYYRRPSDLLAPKPKFYFMDSLERSLLGSPGKSPGQKVDDLVAWVNQTYDQNVKASVQPFGGRTSSSTRDSRTSSDSRFRTSQSSNYSPMHRAEIDEMSSLPSASSSVVDLDSNAGTVETDILLSSFKGDKPEDRYSRSNLYSYTKTRSSSYKTSSKSPQRSSGNFEYPSWVSHLGKEYPSWVEDLDNTALSKRSSRSPQPRFTSSGKSSSDSNLHKPDRNSTRGIEELKLSDLKLRSPTKSRTSKSHHHWTNDGRKSGKDWTDTASMDTDILVSQSIYGHRPVNMGGDLHKTLYEDAKVKRLKKETTKKLRKSPEKSRSRAHERTHERTQVSPRSKSVTYTPEHISQPLSSRGYHSVPPKSRVELERSASPNRYKDYSPLRSGDHRHSPERLELRPTQFSMPVRSPTFQRTDIQTREEKTSPRLHARNTSPMVMRSPSKSQELSRSHARDTRKPITPSHVKHSVTQSRKSRGLNEGGEASDTDREMRKSPTGIRMEKMYREPTTMYPWKSMIQSHNHKSVAFIDDYEYITEKPVYESTPAARNEGIDKRKYVTNKAPSRDSNYASVTGREEYVTKRVTHYFPKKSPGLKSAPPKSVFTSTERTPSIHHKPPIAPRSSQKGGGHRRSRTMPDLRKIGSESRHSGARRSYDDDMLSIVTSDTEVLVTQPPMPIVDASPSLTTVSDSSDTIIGSDTESEREGFAHARHSKTLNKEETFDSTMQRSDGEKFSPTSVFASSSPYAAVREELPKRYHLWKLDEDTTAPESFIKKKRNEKSNIISSFLEDCLNIDDDNYDHNSNKVESSSYHSPSRLSGREAAPGPVEALKNMLFTMQDMAHHEDQSPRTEDNQYFNKSRIPADDVDSLNDDGSDASSQLFHGGESLQRAYHHLQRLKRLVGSEDDQSSLASEL